MAKRPNSPDYAWLEPLRELWLQTSNMHPTFIFFRTVIGGSQGQSLYNLNVFCSLAEPFAPDWTMENLIDLGPNILLKQWAEREMHRRYCDGGGGGA